MSKTVIRITPVGGFDIPGLENWFAVMAGKGLRFSMTTGPLTIFEKTAQQTVQIHLEPIRFTKMQAGTTGGSSVEVFMSLPLTT